MKKTFSIITLLLLMATVGLRAQDTSTKLGNQTPDWKRWHYLSEEEMYDTSRGMNFVETNPPAGEPRFVAEFEPMQGVMIRYPLGIPTSLVVQLANNCRVYCVVTSSQQNQAQNSFQSAGVNMSNVTFVNASTDSYWIRDYGPWYIFEDRNPAIVDNVYNRPRPNDDEISGVFATFWGIPMYGMNLEHTGGNMMEDGRGHGVSDNLVLQENSNNETNVRNKMRDYLGIDPYHITIDPQGDYIAHVDCWGKYLAPDKILIARLPQSNSHYSDYESVANYFANTNCCWGYPYRVYRVDEPGGNTLAPYTNSLILNKTVYVPLGSNTTYNNNALAVYQEAMPGYQIVGVSNSSYQSGWQNTDALHCRTRGVMDFNMLFVDHRDVLFGEQAWQDSIPVVSKFIAYSGANLKQDSLLVYYSIDNGAYQVAHMTATGNADEYVGYIKGYQGESQIDYYVFGADESGHRYTQPVFADLDPHHFTMEAHEDPIPQGELVITPETLTFEAYPETHAFQIINETNSPVIINAINLQPDDNALTLTFGSLPRTLQPNQSMEVEVDLNALGYKGYNTYTINIATSLGDRQVTVNVNEEAWDGGLILMPMQGLTFGETLPTTQTFYLQNTNALQSITLYEITEEGSAYFEMTPSHSLPYDIPAGELFAVTVTLIDFPEQETTANVFVNCSDYQQSTTYFHIGAFEPQPQGELVITPETLTFETWEVKTFNVTNETLDPVTVSVSDFDEQYIASVTPQSFTLQPNESIDVAVELVESVYKAYITTYIDLTTSVGDRIVTVNINEDIFGNGLILWPATGLYFDENSPLTQTFWLKNTNILQSITVNQVYEIGSGYFEMVPSQALPYTIPAGGMFAVTVTLTDFPENETVANVFVNSTDGQINTPFLHIAGGLSGGEGDLVITPDTLWYSQMGETQYFMIINETAEAVTLQDIVPAESSLIIDEITLPLTLETGGRVTVAVQLQTPPGKDNYVAYDIQVMTSLGERHVTAMVQTTVFDSGLVIVGSPYQYVEDMDGAEGVLQNRNFGSENIIKIISITEVETHYLNIVPQYPLPYNLQASDYFNIMFYANAQAKGRVSTTVLVESSDRQCEFYVSINDELFAITELSAEAKLYPNPTADIFTIEGANVDKVEVYNLVGQKVYGQQGCKVVNIDASSWNKGIYLVNIIEHSHTAPGPRTIVSSPTT